MKVRVADVNAVNPFAAAVEKALGSITLAPEKGMTVLTVVHHPRNGGMIFEPQYLKTDKTVFGNPSMRFFYQSEESHRPLKLGQRWRVRIDDARPSLKVNERGIRIVQVRVTLLEVMNENERSGNGRNPHPHSGNLGYDRGMHAQH